MVTNNLNCGKWVMGKCSQVNHIVVAFEEYSETSEQSKINKFTLEDLRKAKALCVGQRNSNWYYLLENRIDELTAKENRKEQIKLLILGALIGILGTLIAQYI